MLINFQFLATSVPELVQVLPIELLTMLLKSNPVLCRVEYRSESNCLPGKSLFLFSFSSFFLFLILQNLFYFVLFSALRLDKAGRLDCVF